MQSVQKLSPEMCCATRKRKCGGRAHKPEGGSRDLNVMWILGFDKKGRKVSKFQCIIKTFNEAFNYGYEFLGCSPDE